MSNTLFYGDNLQVLREHIPDASVDLVYLDPPFNSNAFYNEKIAKLPGRDKSVGSVADFDIRGLEFADRPSC